jgi:hypothetical protein
MESLTPEAINFIYHLQPLLRVQKLAHSLKE